jgi:hypothetical protein
LEAKLGSKPSYTWRSLFGSRDLLFQGLLWRVGDGNSIRVWVDRWLPIPISYSVQSTPKIISANATVDELIDVEMKVWKSCLIKEVFEENEAMVICQIPLSPSFPKDRMVWMGTKNSEFTVRSAYHLCKEIQDREGGQCSSGVKGEEVWKAIWSMEVPNTVKVFRWRACNNILPTKTNLFLKRVVDNMKCPCCEFEDETILHVLWECPASRDVWGGQASCFHKCSCSVLDFKALFEYVMNRFTKEQLALMAVICRRIWLRRNSLIFEGIFLHPNTLMMEAINAQDEYRRCLSPEARIEEGRTSCDRRSRWTYPPEGIYKCNWDASVNVTKGWVGLGIVVRDYYGLILGAKCITMEMVADSSLAKVIGALYAVQFCKEVGFFLTFYLKGMSIQ